MKVSLEKVPRRPNWPLWAVMIVLIWVGLAGTAAFLAGRNRHDISLCLFRTVTGLPCPTCGASRGCLSILEGNVLEGWLYNPLLFTALLVGAAVLLIRLVLGRALRLGLNPVEKIVAWSAGAALVLGNWIYLILCMR